jgi:plastin-1
MQEGGKGAAAHVVQVKKGETTHSFSEEETEAFADYINSVLKNDRDIGSRLPINPKDMSLFASVKDGLLLCKLINDAIADTVDERVLNKGNLNTYQIHENQAVAINSAKAIGCNVGRCLYGYYLLYGSLLLSAVFNI